MRAALVVPSQSGPIRAHARVGECQWRRLMMPRFGRNQLRGSRMLAIVAAVALPVALITSAGTAAAAGVESTASRSLEIRVLSNRADLISAGDALVQVSGPG